MPKLMVISGTQAGREIELKPGLQKVGRQPENDISLPDASISSVHCELDVTDIGVAVHDLGSTNGTFINGERVMKGMLQTGDALLLGEVRFGVELPEIKIALPAPVVEEEQGAAFLDDGSQGCFEHRTTPAEYSCTKCENWWCAECVRRLKRVSGDFLAFCPNCSGPCVPLGSRTEARKTFFRRITDALKTKNGRNR